MLYRLYQPADFAALYALEELCFQPPFRFSRTYMRRLVESPNGATWIAQDNAELVGFAIVEWLREGRPRAAYIPTIEVRPGRRGEGIGAELLRRIEDSASAASAESIWLHVDAENDTAIHLYESCDYHRKGREEHFYARNRAAFAYRKILAQTDPNSAGFTI
jgi:ribosomal-protein-alanine N-acetyltransferase